MVQYSLLLIDLHWNMHIDHYVSETNGRILFRMVQYLLLLMGFHWSIYIEHPFDHDLSKIKIYPRIQIVEYYL
jgi:hypothetical protein